VNVEHHHAICRRADGSVDELTFVVVVGGGAAQATDFRTIDGAPLVLHPQDTIEIQVTTGPDE